MKARFSLAACVCGAFVGTPAVGDFSGTRRENLRSDGEPHARANERTWAIPMFVRSLVRCDVSKRAGVLLFGLRPFCSRDRKATPLPQKKGGPGRGGRRIPACHAPACHAPACRNSARYVPARRLRGRVPVRHAPTCRVPACRVPACRVPACHAPACRNSARYVPARCLRGP